jgi:hypothetical protein
MNKETEVIIFICSLLYDTFSESKNIYRRMNGWLVNDELESIWKEALVAYSVALRRYLPGVTEENRERPHSG